MVISSLLIPHPPRPSLCRSATQRPRRRSLRRSSHVLRIAGSGLVAGVERLVELREVALETAQAAGHDRDVDEQDGEEHQVGGGDVLARLVEGERGHQTIGAALRRGRASSSPSRRRRSARTWSPALLDAISYFQSVRNSSAIPARAMRKVSIISPGIPPVVV